MAEVSTLAPGRFCWVDLATVDPEGAKRFYGGLFGWRFEDRPAGPGIVYTMAAIGGREVAALYRMDDKKRGQGIPSHWQTYVSVQSADATAARAMELGGTLLMPPFDVFEAGRMAPIQDPTGAIFAAWEPRRHAGAPRTGEPGTVCWTELVTRDVGKAGAFYTALFGWGTKVLESGPMPYTIFQVGEEGEAGMMAIPPECGDIPSSWLVYFLVEDCDRSVEQAAALGARTLKGATDIPGIGRFSVLQDPQGAVFAIFKPTM